ncbi:MULTISPECIES: hypothetical protein [unclassified Streptomyces]|uniref:hypothetical protein n=1 Tax=unclassified Streptomyces TaxID=2593676 RepID=UPI0036EE5ACB
MAMESEWRSSEVGEDKNGDERDSEERVVLLEFSASDPSQSLTGALTGVVSSPLLALDLIDVGYGREADLGRRASALADDVAASGAARVKLVASCAASPILAPVARHVGGRGIHVELMAAVDPGPVTEGHIRHTLGRIRASLGCPAEDGEIPDLDLTDPADVVLGRIEEILRVWVERFLRASGTDLVDHDLIRTDLLDRYLRWNAFLLAAFWAPAQAPGGRVDVFLTEPSSQLASVFGPAAPVRRHRYPHRDTPALERDDVLDDLRTLLADAGNG